MTSNFGFSIKAPFCAAIIGLVLWAPAALGQVLNGTATTFAGPDDYTPGTVSGTYTLTITNTSTDTNAVDVDVDFSLPAGATISTVDCQATGTGSSCNSTLDANLASTANAIAASNGFIRFTLTLDFASSMSAPSINVSAQISATDVASFTETATSNLLRISDLSVTKTGPDPLEYVPGADLTYEIVVANAGPSDAVGVALDDPQPTGVSYAWTCTPQAACPVNSGSGDIAQTGLAIADGVALTYTVTASASSSLATDPLVNTATLTVPADLNDPSTDDHVDSVSLARRVEVDLAAAIILPDPLPTSYVPGSSSAQPLSVELTNVGPSDAPGAFFSVTAEPSVVDPVLSCVPVSACTAVFDDATPPAAIPGLLSVDLPASASDSVIVSVELGFASSARDDLTLTTRIQPSEGSDTDTSNDADTLALTVDRRADIDVEILQPAVGESVNPGAGFEYRIKVTNSGPSDLGPGATLSTERGILLNDVFPSGLLGSLDCADNLLPCWSACVDDLGQSGDYTPATCPSPEGSPPSIISGSGNLIDLGFSLAAGSSSTVIARVRAPESATGDLVNTAVATLDESGPVTAFTAGGDEASATLTTPIVFSADVAVTKTDDLTRAVAGATHSYTVTVANQGFLQANNVIVTDEWPLFDPAAFPGLAENAGFRSGTVSWQCRAFEGACCNSGTGNCGAGAPTSPVTVDRLERGDGQPVTIDLPGRTRVEFTITGLIDPLASGTLVNTASVDLPDEITDPNLSNQADTDDNTEIIRQASLLVEKSLVSLTGTGPDGDLPPFTLVYDIRVESQGPSFIAGAAISDPLDNDNFDLGVAPGWTCAVAPGSGVSTCPAESGSGVLNGELFDIAPGGVVNFQVTATTTDLAAGEITNTVSVDAGFGAPFTASTTTSLIGQARLSIDKTDNRGTLAPGSEIDYVIRVENHGPDDVFGAIVEDIFPDTIDGITWMCEATTPIPGDIAPASFTATPADTGGDALVVSPDGRHVYVVGREADSLFVYDRNNVPGTNFGEVVLLGTEINGFSSSGDPGATVGGMQSPFDVVISPDGFNVYVLSANEPEVRLGFVDQFSQGRWTPITQSYGCGSVIGTSTVIASSTQVELATADPCAAIFAGYSHLGAEKAGTVSFNWQVTADKPHTYSARFGIEDQPLATLTNSVEASGTETIRVEAGEKLVFNISKSAGFGISTLIVNGFEFTPDAEQPPTVSAFARKVNPADPDFGRLVYLGSLSDGLPMAPTALAVTNENLYVVGRGDPAGPGGNELDLLSIYERNAQTGLLSADIALTSDLPADLRSLAVDSGGWLLAGGQDLALYAIEPAQGLNPAGRLTRVGDFLDVGTADEVVLNLAMAETASSAYARTSTGRLLWLSYLDDDDNGALAQVGLYTAGTGPNGLGLPVGGGDPFVGIGDIAVAGDGEHLAGVSRERGLVYILRRDLVSGGLSLQEWRAFDVSTGVNRGLSGASGVGFAPDGRHLLIAAAADQASTNPPLTVLTRRAPDPLFAFLEVEREAQDGVEGLLSPTDVAVSPDGAHVYAVSLADNSVTRFNRFARLGLDDESQGQHLQFDRRWTNGSDGVSGLLQPRRILISPDGQSVFVTSEDQDRLVVFGRVADPAAPDYGNLIFLETLVDGQGGIDGLSGARGMAMDPGSEHLYVAGRFANAITHFTRNANGRLSFVETINNGQDGVVGLGGIIDLAMTADGRQLLGVSSISLSTGQRNALVVFDRQFDSGKDGFGSLSFVQRLEAGIGANPVALAISPEADTGGEHVYVVGANSNTLGVLRRVTDSSSSAFGRVQPLTLLSNGSDGISFMSGPSDVSVSPDGRRIYVAAQSSAAVLVFDRDRNRSGSRFGLPTLREIRRQTVRGVDGLVEVRALAISNDSRHVYAAGFGSKAVASFRLGTGSVCSAGGSGNIFDRVDIGAGGTLEFRANGVVRPNALGPLSNTATLSVPENFIPLTLSEDNCPNAAATCSIPLVGPTGCPRDAEYCATDETTLDAAGELQITKTSDQVSLTAGGLARYTVTISNSGPSSLIHEAATPLTLSDRLDEILDGADNSAFVPGSATWTCDAVGSGGLDLIQFWAGDDLAGAAPATFDALGGVSGLALVPGTTGPWLVATSIIDNAVSVFGRDPASGELLTRAIARSGELLDGQLVTSLDGAQGVAVSDDGQFLYIASRVSDAITVLSLSDDGSGGPELAPVQVIENVIGLDQAQHLALSPDQRHLYVAAANDDALMVLTRSAGSGMLAQQQLYREGEGPVTGLNGVAQVLITPDGDQVYAVSPAQGTITWFDRDPVSGLLTWRQTHDALNLGIGLQGASWAVTDTDGRFIYLAARDADRILVLERDLSATAMRGQLSLSSSISQADLAGTGLAGVTRLALSGDEAHLYASSATGGSVAWFVRDADNGSLRFAGVRGAQGSGLGGATGLVIDDQLDQLFVAGTSVGAINQFQRQADSFCEASGSGQIENEPFRIGAGGRVIFSIVVEVAGGATGLIENRAVLDAARNLNGPEQSAGQSNPVSRLADLTITKSDGLSEIDGLAGALAVAGTTDHVYVAGSDDNAIGVFSRFVDPGEPGHGALTFVETARSGIDGVNGLNGVADLLVSADGAHLYAASAADNAVAVFGRAPISGQLSYLQQLQSGVQGVSGLSGATALAASADGAHLYVAGQFGNSLAAFSRNTDPVAENYGQLSFLAQYQNGTGGITGLVAPTAVSVSPDGLHVYAVGNDSNTIAVFRRNRTAGSGGFGELTFLFQYSDAEIASLAGARDIALSADGERVYVLGASEGTLVRFDRDAATGELTFRGFSADGNADVTGLTGARSLLLDDLGGRLYVAGAQAGVITVFAIAPDNDPLQFQGVIANGDPAPLTGGEVFGLDGVAGLFLAPDGDHLYAASSGRNALVNFRIPGDAALPGFQQILIDGLGGVAPGERVTYLIAVANLGPSDVAEARVTDVFPEAFEAMSWECQPVQGTGAECALRGTGNLDTIVGLPVGGQLVISASGTITAGATGRLSNTASVTAIGVTDTNPANNTATDDDTVLSPAMDLVTTIEGVPDTFVPGDVATWNVTIRNLGPSAAPTVLVGDELPAAAFDVSWQCEAIPAAGLLRDRYVTDAALVPQRVIVSPDGRFAYAVGDDAIEAYRRETLTGALDPLQTLIDGQTLFDELNAVIGTVSGLQGASDVVMSGDGRFVYVAGARSDAIAIFERASDTGLLSFVSAVRDGLDIDGLGGVRRLLLSPDGAQLVAGAVGSIIVLGIDETNGQLTALDRLTQGVDGIDGLNGLSDLAWAGDGQWLLATALANESLAVFDRTSGTGTLQLADIVLNDELLGGPAAGSLLGASAVQVLEDEILVASFASNQIGRFRLELTEDESGVTQAGLIARGRIDAAALGQGLTAPRSLAFDPDQARLYVAIDEGVLLISLLGENPAVIALDPLVGLAGLSLGPARRHLYALAANQITVWSRIRGSRCPLGGSGGLGRNEVEIASGGELRYRVDTSIRANATGPFDYTVSADNPISGQELNPADNTATDARMLQPSPDLGVTKALETQRVVAGLPVAWQLGVANAGLSDATGARVLDMLPVFPDDTGGVLAGSGAWTCTANAPLDVPGSFVSDQRPDRLRLGPQGRFLYGVSATEGALLVYPLDNDGLPGQGSVITNGDMLGETGPVAGLAGAAAVAVSEDGLNVYVAGAQDDSLAVFVRDELDAPLQFRQRFRTTAPLSGDAVAGLRGASDVVVSADGRHVLVFGATSNAIAVFRRNADTGLLTWLNRVFDGQGTLVPEFNVIQGGTLLHPTSDGRQLYAYAAGSRAFSRFAVDNENGVLTFEGVQRSDTLPELTEVRALGAAPGDSHLYLLTPTAVLAMARQPDDSLLLSQRFDELGDLSRSSALVLDASGSRAYVFDERDGSVVIHVLRRDWADGALEFWATVDLSGSAPGALALDNSRRGLFAAADDGALLRFAELALSRCSVAADVGDGIDTELDLGMTGTSMFDLDAIVHPSARGQLINGVAVSPGVGIDPRLDDNLAVVIADIDVVSDLAVVKTGPQEAVAGEMIRYDVRVTNAGPSDALGIVFRDPVPAPLLDLTWTCMASAGSTCPESGDGAPDFASNVLVDGQLDLVIEARIDPAFRGQLINVALLTPEVGSEDPTEDDLRAEAITEVVAVAEVSLSKSTLGEVVAGTPLGYRLNIVNAGPSDAAAVRVVDDLSGLPIVASWTCSGDPGVGCDLTTGSGSIDQTLYIPAGAEAVFDIGGPLPPSAQGILVNQASATVLAPTTDPDPSNNVDQVDDEILVIPDVSLVMSARLNAFDPAGTGNLRLSAEVANAGPSLARDLVVEFEWSEPTLVATALPAECALIGGTGLGCVLPDLAPGQTRQLQWSFPVLPDAPSAFTVSGLATTSGDDPDLTNNEDSLQIDLETGIDLDLAIGNGFNGLSLGQTLDYVITLTNIGSVDASVADIELLVPATLLNPQWRCTASGGATCSDSGSGDLVDAVALPAGSAVIYRLTVTVDPDLNLADRPVIEMAVRASTRAPETDINLRNNEAVVSDSIIQAIFRDRFQVGSGSVTTDHRPSHE